MRSAVGSAVARFRELETPQQRGPEFAKVCSAIETLWAVETVSRREILAWIGPPDLFSHLEPAAAYVYRFDHEESGAGRDEWYFTFEAGRLRWSAFNRAGINLHHGFRPVSEFVDPAWE